MEYSTPLDQLPEGVQFPAHLAARIRFNPDSCNLSFCGFMNKCVYDELVRMHTDPRYQLAIERLFVLSAAELEESKAPGNQRVTWSLVWLGLLLAVCGAAYWANQSIIPTDSPR